MCKDDAKESHFPIPYWSCTRVVSPIIYKKIYVSSIPQYNLWLYFAWLQKSWITDGSIFNTKCTTSTSNLISHCFVPNHWVVSHCFVPNHWVVRLSLGVVDWDGRQKPCCYDHSSVMPATLIQIVTKSLHYQELWRMDVLVQLKDLLKKKRVNGYWASQKYLAL